MKRALLLAGLWVGIVSAQEVPTPAPAPEADRRSDPDQAPEWRGEIAADVLRVRIGDRAAAHDATGLRPLLAQVAQFRTAEGYPALVRAAIDAIDTATAAADPAVGKGGTLLAEREAAVAEREQSAAALRALLDHPFPAYETRPSEAAPAGTVYLNDQTYQRVFVVPIPAPGGRAGGVYAHHYAGFEPYYPDPRGLYPYLSESDLTQAQACLAAIQRAETRIGQVDNTLAAADAERMGNRVALAGSRAVLLEEPAALDEQVLARLRAAASVDPAASGPVLDQAEHDWPGSGAAQRLALDQAARALDRADAALGEGRRADAAVAAQTARELVDRVTTPSPRRERLRERIGALAQAQAQAPALPAAAPRPAAVSPAQQEESRRHLAEAEAALRAGRWQEVVPAFQEAQRLWPASPEAASRLRIAEIAAGLAALLILVMVLYLWTLYANWQDKVRFRRAMRDQAKRGY